ncbi:hypothetical protein SLE2022_176440 [Rubroshorea leprosula]
MSLHVGEVAGENELLKYDESEYLLVVGISAAGFDTLFSKLKEIKAENNRPSRVLQINFCSRNGTLGGCLDLVYTIYGSGIFSRDPKGLEIICIGLPIVAATQPINSIAFVFDGINFGASDFAYTAYSMELVAGVSIGSLFFLSKSNGFVGIWIALTIYMILRMFAGVWRMGTGTGPWSYLRK